MTIKVRGPHVRSKPRVQGSGGASSSSFFHFPSTIRPKTQNPSSTTKNTKKMNLTNSEKAPTTFPPPKQPQPQLNLQQAFTTFQHNCSSLFNQISHNTRTHLQSTLSQLQSRTKFPFFERSSNGSSRKNPVWARISPTNNAPQIPWNSRVRGPRTGMSTEAIEERLAGVPVYALSNASEEFVLVSGASSGKSLGLFCFRKEDAEALLDQIASMDPRMQDGSKVVAVALNKVV